MIRGVEGIGAKVVSCSQLRFTLLLSAHTFILFTCVAGSIVGNAHKSCNCSGASHDLGTVEVFQGTKYARMLEQHCMWFFPGWCWGLVVYFLCGTTVSWLPFVWLLASLLQLSPAFKSAADMETSALHTMYPTRLPPQIAAFAPIISLVDASAAVTGTSVRLVSKVQEY